MYAYKVPRNVLTRPFNLFFCMHAFFQNITWFLPILYSFFMLRLSLGFLHLASCTVTMYPVHSKSSVVSCLKRTHSQLLHWLFITFKENRAVHWQRTTDGCIFQSKTCWMWCALWIHVPTKNVLLWRAWMFALFVLTSPSASASWIISWSTFIAFVYARIWSTCSSFQPFSICMCSTKVRLAFSQFCKAFSYSE